MTASRRSSTRQQQSTLNTSNPTLMAQDPSPGIPSAYTETNSVSTAQPLEDSTIPATEEDDEMVDNLSDDESSDDNAITRCPCGKEKLPYYLTNGNDDNDEGLMVQCDQCEVWQHCKCVGLEEEKDIPDQYYCEQCRPENHKAVKSAHGRRCKRFYNSLGFAQDTIQDQQQSTKPAKRRKKAMEVPGSRKSTRQFSTRRSDTSSSATQNELNGTKGSPLSPIPSDSTDTDGGWHSHGKGTAMMVTTSDTNSTADADEATVATTTSTITTAIATTSKRSRRSVHSPVTDSHIPSSDSPSPTLTRRKKSTSSSNAASNATTTPSHLQHVPTSSPSSSSTHQNAAVPPSTGTKRGSSSSSSSSSSSTAATSPSRNAQGRFHKNAFESRASTPYPTTTTSHSTPPMTTRDEGTASYWNENGLPQREGSPPAKVKYPSSKMTMADMNKRAKQIMDHLDKIKSTLQQQQQQGNGTTHMATGTGIIKNMTTTTKPSGSTSADIQQNDVTSGPLPITTQAPQRNDNDGEQQQHNDGEQRPRSLSTCSVSSSISSASTLPLLLDDDDASFQSSLLLSTSPTTPLPLDKLFDRNGDGQQQQQESSMDIMDRVYQELLKFQRKFGGVLQVQQASSVR